MTEAEDPKAKRRRQATERRAWVKAQRDAWQAKVATHFGYLEQDYGFQIDSVEFSAWVTRVIYRSTTTAVFVDRSVEFNRVEITIGPLIDGEFPIAPGKRKLHFLDSIVEFHVPELYTQIMELRGIDDDQVELALTFWSEALRAYAVDMLRGDFSVFPHVSAMLRERRSRQS